MAEVFAPFVVKGTMCNLTFYCMEGRNFVRKKSSLTRRKVLYSPHFENTRRNASLMAQASKIGSFIYNSLPVHWRQSWMYRSFTGEAYTMLKKRKDELEIKKLLLDRYVKEVIEKPVKANPLFPELTTVKRSYKKKDTAYWEAKTRKSIQRKFRKEQRKENAGILAEASQIASKIYRELPARERKRHVYQQLTGWAMRWLKEQMKEEAATKKPSPQIQLNVTQQQDGSNNLGVLRFGKGTFYFKTPVFKREYPQPASKSPCYFSRIKMVSFNVASIRISHDNSNFCDPALSITKTPQVPQHPPP